VNASVAVKDWLGRTRRDEDEVVLRAIRNACLGAARMRGTAEQDGRRYVILKIT